jgi:hypothetical protein
MGANAQTAVPAFTAGQVLTAAQMTEVNTGIPVFATTTPRDAAFGGTGEKTLAQGQFAFIEASNVTQYYNGSTWVNISTAGYTAYTPTFTNFTLGNGTITARFAQVGLTVHCYGQVALGSTSSVGTNMTISMPTNIATTAYMVGSVNFEDVPSGSFSGSAFRATATNILPLAQNATGTYVFDNGTSATIPFTWGTNDRIIWNVIYESA